MAKISNDIKNVIKAEGEVLLNEYSDTTPKTKAGKILRFISRLAAKILPFVNVNKNVNNARK